MSRRRKQRNSIGTGVNPVKIARSVHPLGVLKVFIFLCLLGAILAGFAFLDGYVKKQAIGVQGNRTIELAGDIPEWVSEEIKNRVFAAATAETNIGTFDENTALVVQSNIEQMVPWLNDVRVQTTYDSVRISCRWRRPIAVVTAGKEKYFIDANLVALDYLPMMDLPVVTVSGLAEDKHPLRPGEVCQGDDLAAALAVLSRMQRMDFAVCANKPLLREIESIDVSNFDGRNNKNQPHIVLYTKENTQIIWGAEIGTWQRHLESPDDDKLAKLYTYYQQVGTLSDVKYINLRDPSQTIYLPVDKY